MKRIFLSLTVALMAIILVACEEPTFYINVYEDTNSTTFESYTDAREIYAPTKEGFDFMGWYLDKDFKEEFEPTLELTEDLDVFAKWKEKEFIVTYSISGDSHRLSSDIVHYFDESIELPVITEDEYDFSGWFMDPELTVDADTRNPRNHVTFYGELLEIEDEIIPDYDIALMLGTGFITGESIYSVVHQQILDFATNNNLSYNYYQSNNTTYEAYMFSIDVAVEEGAEVVVLPGFLFDQVAFEAQTKYPETKFIILDGIPNNLQNNEGIPIEYTTTENTISVQFKTNESGFLAGYAAVIDGARNLGFIGGMALPEIQQYAIGFIAGAYHAADVLEVEITFDDSQYLYTNTILPNSETHNAAIDMYQSGVEVIFTIAGGASNSVMFAAQSLNGLIISSDVSASSVSTSVYTSALKNYGYITGVILEDYFNNNTFNDGIRYIGLAENGVSLDIENGRFITYGVTENDAIVQQIISGTVIVPTNYTELSTFLGDESSNFSEQTILGSN